MKGPGSVTVSLPRFGVEDPNGLDARPQVLSNLEHQVVGPVELRHDLNDKVRNNRDRHLIRFDIPHSLAPKEHNIRPADGILGELYTDCINDLPQVVLLDPLIEPPVNISANDIVPGTGDGVTKSSPRSSSYRTPGGSSKASYCSMVSKVRIAMGFILPTSRLPRNIVDNQLQCRHRRVVGGALQ